MRKKRLKMLTKGFELGTFGSKGQCSTTELKFLYNMMDTNFEIRRDVGVCDHHTPLGKIARKIP